MDANNLNRDTLLEGGSPVHGLNLHGGEPSWWIDGPPLHRALVELRA